MRLLICQNHPYNQSLIPYRGRKAVVQLTNQIMGRLIIASQYLAFRKLMAIGIQRLSFPLGKEERHEGCEGPNAPRQSRRRKN